MASYFLDTSALGKRYHTEVGSAKVEALFQEPQATFFISRLSVVEIQSVFAGKVRTQVITAADLQLLRLLFLTDVANQVFRVVRLTSAHYNEAELLIHKHATVKSLRTLDSIQLAVALELHQRGLLDYFVCADRKLCEVAKHEGLAVINPEIP